MQQQPSTSNTKKYGTIVIVVLVFILVYFFFGNNAPATTLKTGSTFGAVGSSELSLLNQVRALKIDTTLFTDPAFNSLVDHTSTTTAELVGRPNPFAPLPGESVKPAATQTQTPAQAQAQSSLSTPAKTK